ncbi:FAD dependent oxidoreductase [Hyaloscypha variabilis]
MALLFIWTIALSYCVGSAWTSATCDQLATSGITIEPYESPAYDYDQTQYWSSACSALLPGCILVPDSAAQISLIVKTLLENDEKFAIKSGGHNPNQNFSSVAGGPLINLKNLTEVTYDAESGTARVGAGNRWSAVILALQPYNVTVVGGRIGHVGVGGYLLGGGLSYLSTQYGWAADNIVAAEVVLANGEIVNATETSNVDLFNVLRGGGNNFGIVTTYTLKTHPVGEIWGGIVVFESSPTVNDQILTAIRNFVEYYPDDKAAIIVTEELTLASQQDIWLLFLFYDGPVPPPGTFDNITDIGPIVNTATTTTYYDFVSQEDAEVFMGGVYMIATESTSLPAADVGLEVLSSYRDHFVDVAMANAQVPGLVATMAYQPIPKGLAVKALENGGDLIALDNFVDRIFFEFDYSFISTASVPQMNGVIETLFSGIQERVSAFTANGTLPEAYLPLFANDANFQEDYWGRLRPETLAYAEIVRDEYDPFGFFKDRTGGFKL